MHIHAQPTSGLYYNRATIVATIVTQISWIILIIFKLLIVTTNGLAYLGNNCSYDCNLVIVQATADWTQNACLRCQCLKLIQPKSLLLGPWWWYSGQRSRLLLRRSEFDSRWFLYYSVIVLYEKDKK